MDESDPKDGGHRILINREERKNSKVIKGKVWNPGKDLDKWTNRIRRMEVIGF
jgi:hypothetical protein